MRVKLSLSNRKNIYMGAAGSLISLLLCAYQHEIARGVVFAGCFVILSLLEVRSNESVAGWINLAWCAFSAAVAIVLSQLLLNVGIASITPQKLLLGVVVIEALISLLFVITMNYRAAVMLVVFATLALTTVNHFVYWFRGSEFAPYDILAAATAMNVAGNYAFEITTPMAYAYIIGMLYCFAGFVLPESKVKRSLKTSLIGVSVTACLFCAFCLESTGIKAQHFGQMGSCNNGYLLNFSLQFRNLTVEKPENYSKDAVRKLETQYQTGKTAEIPDVDVIVIMSEAFGDLSILGKQLDTNAEVMPFVQSLQENTIQGHALVAGFGGGTSKSEYEFLASNSLGLLPAGCFPFQQYVEAGSYSIVTGMENYDYVTLGTHPANGNNWMRKTVYPNFGFDEYYFIEGYPQENTLRDMVSDAEMFEQLIRWYESKPEVDNHFIFGVTMQNHSPYDYPSVEVSSPVELNGLRQKYSDVEQYLSLLNESDNAFENLITYFQNVDKDVVVVVFGDHMPQLSSVFYEELHGGPFHTLEEQVLIYTVPFFIWTNYDIEEQDVGLTSLNFLANYVYEAAGLPLPPYNAFLQDVQEVIPAMNTFGYYSKTRGTMIPYEEAEGEEAEMLNLYRILQYNCLFDKGNRSQVFFPEAS